MKQASPQDIHAHVYRVVGGAKTSFYWAMRLQPREKRDALFAIYAFCREVDDIVDEAGTEAEKKMALEAWRREIRTLYSGGEPSLMTGRALKPVIEHYGLDERAFHEIIDGMESDMGLGLVAPTMAELELYCHRVAGAVGLLCIHVFGEVGERGRALSHHLGLALQLTNILRDVDEDAERGRLYLPQEVLDAAGIREIRPAAVIEDDRVRDAAEILGERADDEFKKAEALIAEADPKGVKPALIMMKVYERTLRKMQETNYDHIGTGQRPQGLSRAVDRFLKLVIALRYGVFG